MEKNKKSTCCGKCRKLTDTQRNHVSEFIGDDEGPVFTVKDTANYVQRLPWLRKIEVNPVPSERGGK